jgi:hypothetical protein
MTYYFCSLGTIYPLSPNTKQGKIEKTASTMELFRNERRECRVSSGLQD